MTTGTENKEIWLIFQKNGLIIEQTQDTYSFLSPDAASPLTNHLLRKYLIVQEQTVHIYTAELPTEFELPSEFTSISLRKALEVFSTDWYTVVAKAFSIINWDKNHQYCGHCGEQTTHRQGTFERACPACDLIFYPRISPSVIVLIQNNDSILMARGPHFIKGAYGLIAGFVESGESLEEAIHREVREEVNISIKNLNYFGSQSWPFPDSLMMAFTAEYESGEIIINRDEIEDAGWYRFDNLPGKPSSSVSIARKLIDHFVQQKMAEYNHI